MRGARIHGLRGLRDRRADDRDVPESRMTVADEEVGLHAARCSLPPVRSSDPIVPGCELMGLQHILNCQGHHVAELARVGGDNLNHAIDHLLRVEVAER